MKKSPISLFVCLVAVGLPDAYASTYQGAIKGMRVDAAPWGSTRVSVLTSGTTQCKATGWYSFEYSRRGPGSAWLASLLSARMTQESITIKGTGACTLAGMEAIGEIDLGDTQTSANSRRESDEVLSGSNTTDTGMFPSKVSVIQIGTNAAGEGQYKAADSGPVLAYTIFSIYKQANNFCAQQKKQVATVELKQDPERQTVMHKHLHTELVFECAQISQTCGMSVSEGGVVQMGTGDVKLKDGAILHYKRCSDRALSDSPPPP